MNIYLLNINSIRLCEEELSKITDGKDNITYLDFDEISVDNIIEECSYFSLLNEEKIVIVKNFKINSGSKEIESYFNNFNKNTRLVLLVKGIDKRSTLYKKIKQLGTIIEIEELKPNELTTKVKNYVKRNHLKIDNNALELLIDYNQSNYDLILSEIDKFSIITDNITKDIVINYGNVIGEKDAFGLCDAILNKNINKINELLDDFERNNGEIIPLVALLAGSFRLIKAVKELDGNDNIIANILNVHSYRIKLARDKSYLYTKEEIDNIMFNLCDLDLELKSLNINQYILFKKFLIKII